MEFKQTVHILGLDERTGEKNGKIWRLVIVHLLSNEYKVYNAILNRKLSESPRLAELTQIHNEEYEVTLKIVPKGNFDIQLELVDF